jgi:exodeoxyribonuclease-1
MWNKNTSEITLLWYDYETWGADPKRDRIAQFAAVRTDMDLNPIAEPINLLCKPPIDTVIDPESVTITGLSPVELLESGLSEWDFAQQIHTHMSLPGTCTVGYNTIRFDDECTRYLFYRNLLDPYAREWKNSNSRWDILDIVRMTKALRPNGIEWPLHEDGSPSFKLEHLTAANGLSHENAHDAVSDVLATIDMAKLIKTKQPKLFNYAFKLRSKHEVRRHIDIEQRNLHLHFTGKIPAKEHCMGIEMPLLVHPDRANEIIVIDLREDPSWLLEHDAETLVTWLYAKKDELPEGCKRPPFKTIHINRSPMIAPIALLDDETAQRLNVDMEQIKKHKEFVDKHHEISRLALDMFTQSQDHEPPEDPEHALYAGFIDDHDRNLLNKMVKDKISKERWLQEAHALHDDRLEPLIINVLARHFPDKLSEKELEHWKQDRRHTLENTNTGQSLTVHAAIQKIEALLKDKPADQSLVDTHKYLLNLKKDWLDTRLSNSSTKLEGNSDQPYRSEQEEPNPNLNDQLDLF